MSTRTNGRRWDAIVIGAGPAGIAAAIQLKRMGYRILILEKSYVGGLVRHARWVENYPVLPKPLRGKNVADLFQHWIQRHRLMVLESEVVDIQKEEGCFVVRAGKDRYVSRSIVVASGTRPRKLGIPGERLLAGKRLFYDVESIPELHRGNSTIAILGSGDIAFDYAWNLARRGIRNSILMRSSVPRCIPLLARKAGGNPRITICKNTAIAALAPIKGKVEMRCRNGQNPRSKRNQVFRFDYILVAIGRDPNLGFLPAAWQRKLWKNPQALQREGVYLAGDANPQNFRQVAIAVGNGLQAAMGLGRFLA